ncbi:hypothetical protein LTR91_010353 [Friedmanniomyces endolithicus]|uniref:Thioesterase domain-containing protein n=1 Tax=Friedmanniomyces endolithicus TaxID=329885 RepID=A0AAN6KJL2_9PEZI|nr:hypothetical protein LTR94_020641 [Friedmanniomyces endolithicus]KAK0770272.1 hypothetical protein LTR59_016579 [Friedmanniomyces endolithicus]KAK0788867.1 hypothetical protein LTR38_011118 [Friedmanniomyces endolithicus]KAK0795492.1 hypothetical protein LTR75_010525 [Friedmanniomyces endolithicus]KAK0826053.1 hypothetical protein LTR03_017277 [Friedmanniomyces endolithicus]
MADHPDFQALPWTQRLLASPNLTIIPENNTEDMTPTAMFNTTLYRPGAITAHLSFSRPATAPDALHSGGGSVNEQCMLLSLGHALDGKPGRAHGGFNSLVLDQLCGKAAHYSAPNTIPPATATLTVDYRAPVGTPCVVLGRAWVVEVTGRKIWVRGVIEDGEGVVLASGRALFIAGREGVL